MTIFDDMVLGVDEPDPDRPVQTFSEAYHRLRPNEVAGTWDVDGINAIMREALGDDWAAAFVTKDTGREQRPMLWSDCLPPQDAPALGFRTEPLIGAEVMPDATPPTVTKPDLQADLVKAFKLVEDAPYRLTHPAAMPARRVEVSAGLVADPAVSAADHHAALSETLNEMFERYAERLDAILKPVARVGAILCVHDSGIRVAPDHRFDNDAMYFTIGGRCHVLWPGQGCAAPNRTQYVGSAIDAEVRRGWMRYVGFLLGIRYGEPA